MRGPVGVSDGWGERTTADLSSLLVELSRVQKGVTFYAEDHATSHDLLERAFLAWRGELERAGPLDLTIDPSGFRAAGVEEALSGSYLAGLLEALLSHDIRRLQFGRDTSREAFHRFVRLLAAPPTPGAAPDEADADQFSRRLYEDEHRGIAVNGQPGPAGSPAEPKLAGARESCASLGSALLGVRAPATGPDPEEGKLTIDEDPLSAPASSEAADELVSALRRLDWCSADGEYQELSAQVVALANQLAAEGSIDEAYRAPLVLARHAAGGGGRSGPQVEAARAALGQLAAAGRLSEIIDRASSLDGRRGVRAAQVLLQLGELAAPAILERLERGGEGEGAAQLVAVMVALGESAVPAVAKQMAETAEARVLLAVRLAGELQNPALVAPLRELLRSAATRIAKEAARSLAHIGNSEALSALSEALSSPKLDVARAAAFCLGVLRDPRTAKPLLASLAQARKRRQTALARDIIRALGQFKRGTDVVVRELVAILERRIPPWRAEERQLKLEAARALGQLPGEKALQALREAAKSRTGELRRCAEKALARRASNA